MSLTKGSGPFGSSPAGSFNFDPQVPEHVLYVESCPRRVRVLFGGRTVADSTGVLLLHPPERTPTYLFPREHVQMQFLDPAGHQGSDAAMGAATYWTVRVDDRYAPKAAYSYEDPPETASKIAGLVAFDWDSMDALFEEDEQVFVHPRDPYTRIDVLRSSRRVRVFFGESLVADSTRPRLLFESGLPVR